MKVSDVRRLKLRQWIDDHYGGVALQFAHAVNKPQSQIADMLRGGKSFGEKVARDLEGRAGMPPGYLDGRGIPPDRAQTILTHGREITPEEADIGREWGKLVEPQRSMIASTIHMWVAAQKRGDAPRQTTEPTKTTPKRGRVSATQKN